MSTPLGKAKEIFDKIYDLEGKAISKIDAYKLSVICAKEVLRELSELPKIPYNERRTNYWQEVVNHLKNKHV